MLFSLNLWIRNMCKICDKNALRETGTHKMRLCLGWIRCYCINRTYNLCIWKAAPLPSFCRLTRPRSGSSLVLGGGNLEESGWVLALGRLGLEATCLAISTVFRCSLMGSKPVAERAALQGLFGVACTQLSAQFLSLQMQKEPFSCLSIRVCLLLPTRTSPSVLKLDTFILG